MQPPLQRTTKAGRVISGGGFDYISISYLAVNIKSSGKSRTDGPTMQV
jgi:hypothetical protein